MSTKNFSEKIEWWESNAIDDKASFKVVHKLKVIKLAIKEWCKEEEQKQCIIIQALFQDIAALDGLENEGGMSVEEITRKEQLKIELGLRLQREWIGGKNQELGG